MSLLHCTALYCISLHCTALHCTVSYFTALHCTVQHSTALHCISLHCIDLHCTALHFTALYYPTRHSNELHCTLLHFTLLDRTARYYTASGCTALLQSLLQCGGKRPIQQRLPRILLPLPTHTQASSSCSYLQSGHGTCTHALCTQHPYPCTLHMYYCTHAHSTLYPVTLHLLVQSYLLIFNP